VSAPSAQTATQLLHYHLCQLWFTHSTIKNMQQDRILCTATFTECMGEKPMSWMLRVDYTDRQKAQLHTSASFPYKRIVLKFELKLSQETLIITW